MKIHRITVVAMMLLWATLCIAQDQSLGDVARESRTRAQGTKPAKVLSNEDSDGQAITAKDEPADVIPKAVAAMLRDTSHSCRKLITGNAEGPPLARLIEIAAADRIHVKAEQLSPPRTLAELIVVGNDAYGKVGDGPWQKASDEEKADFEIPDLSTLIPEELKSGYTNDNLKLVGPMVVNGVATFQYQSTLRNDDVNQTTNLWVGAGDYLPRRTEIQTHYLKMNTGRDETTDCTYGARISIEPPF